MTTTDATAAQEKVYKITLTTLDEETPGNTKIELDGKELFSQTNTCVDPHADDTTADHLVTAIMDCIMTAKTIAEGLNCVNPRNALCDLYVHGNMSILNNILLVYFYLKQIRHLYISGRDTCQIGHHVIETVTWTQNCHKQHLSAPLKFSCKKLFIHADSYTCSSCYDILLHKSTPNAIFQDLQADAKSQTLTPAETTVRTAATMEEKLAIFPDNGDLHAFVHAPTSDLHGFILSYGISDAKHHTIKRYGGECSNIINMLARISSFVDAVAQQNKRNNKPNYIKHIEFAAFPDNLQEQCIGYFEKAGFEIGHSVWNGDNVTMSPLFENAVGGKTATTATPTRTLYNDFARVRRHPNEHKPNIIAPSTVLSNSQLCPHTLAFFAPITECPGYAAIQYLSETTPICLRNVGLYDDGTYRTMGHMLVTVEVNARIWKTQKPLGSKLTEVEFVDFPCEMMDELRAYFTIDGKSMCTITFGSTPQTSDEKPAEDKPSEDKLAEDKPADDEPAEDKPADDEPAEDKPAEDKPADVEPADDKPDDEPAEDKPTDSTTQETSQTGDKYVLESLVAQAEKKIESVESEAADLKKIIRQMQKTIANITLDSNGKMKA